MVFDLLQNKREKEKKERRKKHCSARPDDAVIRHKKEIISKKDIRLKLQVLSPWDSQLELVSKELTITCL